jgi:hypothetical protein
MQGVLKLFAILFLVMNSFSVYGQADSIRHQIGVGIWPMYYKYPFLSVEYKTFFKKRAFYHFNVEAFYYTFKKTNNSTGYRFDIAASSGVGLKYDFFKICRFNMAAQVTGFFARESGRSREGLFIGPELGLQLRAARFKSNELSIFYKIHSGFGFMHEKLYNYNSDPRFEEDTDKIYPKGLGSIMVGINYRF